MASGVREGFQGKIACDDLLSHPHSLTTALKTGYLWIPRGLGAFEERLSIFGELCLR